MILTLLNIPLPPLALPHMGGPFGGWGLNPPPLWVALGVKKKPDLTPCVLLMGSYGIRHVGGGLGGTGHSGFKCKMGLKSGRWRKAARSNLTPHIPKQGSEPHSQIKPNKFKQKQKIDLGNSHFLIFFKSNNLKKEYRKVEKIHSSKRENDRHRWNKSQRQMQTRNKMTHSVQINGKWRGQQRLGKDNNNEQLGLRRGGMYRHP